MEHRSADRGPQWYGGQERVGPAVHAGRSMHPIGVTGRPNDAPPSKIPVRRRTPVGGPVRSGAVNRTVVPSRLPRCGHSPTARARPRMPTCRFSPATPTSRAPIGSPSCDPRSRRCCCSWSACSIGWLCLATPLVTSFVPQGRPSVAETATGVIAWGFAIVVPAAFLIIGVARIAAIIDTTLQMRPCGHVRPREGPRPRVRRRDRRLSFPAAGASTSSSSARSGSWSSRSSRRRTSRATSARRWELRDDRGRWLPIEAPLDRASRDAERVRGWLAGEDRDFVGPRLRGIVTDDKTVERTPACAVVAPAELAAGSRRCRPARPQRRAPGVARRDASRRRPPTPDPGSTRPLAAEGGRGARTRTWNRRDISPLL